MALPSFIPNEMILASAGSGKTWQLTNRYIALMAVQLRAGLPVEPERILAITFTRKAAGEFFDSILKKLAEAASDPDEAAKLAASADGVAGQILEGLTTKEYTHLLRVFITRMPRLFLGTLDSFFANLLGAFPAEFGLSGDYETMDDHRAAVARMSVYDRVFTNRNRGTSTDTAQAAFLESFRLATLGKEENRIVPLLDGFIDDHHELYLQAASAERWGNEATIWPDGGAFWFPGEIDPVAEAQRLERALSSIEASGKKVEWKYWREFFEEIPEHRPGQPLSSRIKYVAERVLPAWKDVVSGKADIKFNKTVQTLGPNACEPLQRIFQWIIGGELRVKLDRTRGLREVLEHYESSYAERVRKRGLLTFQDVQLLLAGHAAPGADASPLFTQLPDFDDRLRIDYRLDARYDHWLLDEFQDTNLLQWRVIENLVDEVMQDQSGTRSLFQVGDLKQAIYAWRGGETRLFADIAARYNAHEERLVRRHLDVSWRSGHDIIDPVNRIFGDRGALSALSLPQEAIDQWEWHDHRVSPRGENYRGCTYQLEPIAPDGAKAEKEDIHALVAAILEEIDPVRRGISCAILVQKNREGEELVDALRSRIRIPVVSESEIFIATDNPLNRALASLFQVAAHPGDTFAWEHLRIGPLGAGFEAESMTAGKLSLDLLRGIFEDGFESVARHWISELETASGAPLDPFTRARAEEFAMAARLFDETGSRNIDDFLEYLSHYRIREASTQNAVQVMTIHKSKGLTFDAVILPDLGGDSLNIPRHDIGAKKDESREIAWVLELPRKDFVAADPVLAAYANERSAEAAYESLCKFYVAMTRASRANYLITLPRPASSSSHNFLELLEETLGKGDDEIEFGDVPAKVLYQSHTKQTDRQWYEAFSPSFASAPEAEVFAGLDQGLSRSRPRRRTPSGSEAVTVTAAQILHRRGGQARDFGTLVHALFESIEWSDELAPDHWEEARAQLGGDAGLYEEALATVRSALAIPALGKALARPSSRAEVWRERNFEILLGDDWISGTFDRVAIEFDEVGQATSAVLLDFKTDRVEIEEEIDAAVAKYAPQLELYRRVLSRMLRLPEDRIRRRLLFTTPRVIREF